MLRLIVTGASGDLGRPLSMLAASRWETIGTYVTRPQIGGGQAVPLDVCDRASVDALFFEWRPDVVIHTAISEHSPDMRRAIPLAARNVASAAKSIGSRLISLSTDMIFDGRNPPYGEADHPGPLSDYGKAKALAERLTLETYPAALIVRTSLIYELDSRNRQVSWMLKAIAEGQPVTLFEDEIRQPIWGPNLAEALLELASLDVSGILHVAGGSPMSRWDYGSALLAALGYDPGEVAIPIRAAEVAPNRPLNCTMCLDRARAVLRTRLLTVPEALRPSYLNHHQPMVG
jgi:dTDP-4-dehydrorhamnose reductase